MLEAHACIDTIPNLYPLIPLDHRAPTFGWDRLATVLGRRLRRTHLAHRVPLRRRPVRHRGQGVARPAAKLGGAAPVGRRCKDGQGLNPTVDVPGEEGATYDVRVDRGRQAEEPDDLDLQAHDAALRRDAATYDPLVIQDVAATGWFLGTGTGISNAVAPGHRDVHVQGRTGHGGLRHGWAGGTSGYRDGGRDRSTGSRRPADDRGRLTSLCTPPAVLTMTDNANPHTLVVTGTSAIELLDRRVLRDAVGSHVGAAGGLALAGFPPRQHEQQVAQPVEVATHRRVDLALCVFEGHDGAFCPADRAARDVDRRRSPGSPRAR